ncbi:L,D-transpeptidase family protein [Helicobacter bizzozeronii]|uniref:L,D-transpeptidase family protein n=1 Tax=Helicobacter bizzozeronii TaxID=56877 RepID=UPI000CEE2318|nr:L,D-transpeptidase family protein [Helicobacter bizzozeronii]
MIGFKGARVLALSVLLGVGAQADSLVDFVNTYRQKGIEALDKLLQSYLTQQQFWEDMLSKQDTIYGYYEKLDYLFVINKARPQLSLYKLEDGKLDRVGDSKALVGSKSGYKLLEGDKATPIGVYQITRKLTGLSAYYGPFALETNYPNAYDRALKRTGHGIWIHGLPLDGNRNDLNTKGCIAIENNILKDYDKLVKGKKALLVVYEKQFAPATKKDLALVLSSLYAWRLAWAKNDLASYLEFYASSFRHANGMDFKAYQRFKTKIFAKNENKTIRFSQINVTPYPNNEDRSLFRVAFMQTYEAYKHKKLAYSSHGLKELYVEIKNNKMQILTEK